MSEAVCSECFQDQGLRLDAAKLGVADGTTCERCSSSAGATLDSRAMRVLATRFFVWGTLDRGRFGGAPLIVFNEHQRTSVGFGPHLDCDVKIFEEKLGIGFFGYGPNLWMLGYIEPLEALETPEGRPQVVDRILNEYPVRTLDESSLFYRVRKDPKPANDSSQYDSPPAEFSGTGRLDALGWPVFYASQDLEVCVHECRYTADDDLYVASLAPTRKLRVLDLTEILEEDVTEFESLDLAVNMLFLAGKHAYEITREISRSAHAAGLDGIIYPSYFSLLRTGGMPFESAFGLSARKLPNLMDNEKTKIIGNLALFGRPVESGLVEVRCINKLIVRRVEYSFHFGPASFKHLKPDEPGNL